MNETYRTFFGFAKEPFASDLTLKEILQTEELIGVHKRFVYTLALGGIGLVTGEIGSGKSTALRYAAGKLHPSEYQSIYVIATSGLLSPVTNGPTIAGQWTHAEVVDFEY